MLDISTGVPSLLTDAQPDALIPLMENAEKAPVRSRRAEWPARLLS